MIRPWLQSFKLAYQLRADSFELVRVSDHLREGVKLCAGRTGCALKSDFYNEYIRRSVGWGLTDFLDNHGYTYLLHDDDEEYTLYNIQPARKDIH